ncbi:MAG: hypothetical protein IPH12_16055 [Saprospirales bacterium]|nr:hypothetical protein [Saprospirales bacterium]
MKGKLLHHTNKSGLSELPAKAAAPSKMILLFRISGGQTAQSGGVNFSKVADCQFLEPYAKNNPHV